MFEKFSNLDIDSAGRGGEYTVQAGFGWTNGVALWIAAHYGDVLVTPQCPSLLDSAEALGVSSSAGATGTGGSSTSGGAGPSGSGSAAGGTPTGAGVRMVPGVGASIMVVAAAMAMMV
jgi:alpha,alpha-trehalase